MVRNTWRHVKAYRNLPPKIKKRYFMWYRVESDKMSRCKLFISIFTWGFLKGLLLIWSQISWNVVRIATCCADVSKPLGTFRRFLVKWICKIVSRVVLYSYGYYWIRTSKRKI